jgi:hypothetical protein
MPVFLAHMPACLRIMQPAKPARELVRRQQYRALGASDAGSHPLSKGDS